MLRRGVLVVGADENGLGPQLGPLIATAATIECRRYDPEKLRDLAISAGVGDSKQTSAFGKMSVAEGLTLAIAEAELGRVPSNFDSLLEALAIDGPLALRAPCPAPHVQDQCWSRPVALPAFGGDLEQGREMLATLAQGGVHIRRVRTSLACAQVINQEKAVGRSKLRLDLDLFERLLLDARRAGKKDILAICGMVGGIRDYANYFTRLQVHQSTAPQAYAVRDVGEVRFEVKADDRHLPVSLASMVGKVIRELAMRRIVRFYQGHDDSLRDVSGYHDSVTKGFVKATASLRTQLRIVDSCFFR